MKAQMTFIGRQSLLIAIVAVLSSMGHVARAEVMATTDVPNLVKASDLIVVGSVVDSSQGDPAIKTFTVDRTIYGDLHAKTITVRTDSSLKRGFVAGQYGIAFLKNGPDGSFLPVDAYYSIYPAADKTPSYAGSDAMTMVADELVEVLAIPRSTLLAHSPFVGIPVPAPHNLEAGKSAVVYGYVADAIDSIPVEDLPQERLRQLAAPTSPELTRLWATDFLIHAGVLDALSPIVPLLNTPGDEVSQGTLSTIGFSIARLRLQKQSDREQIAPALGELLNSSSVEIRRGAAGALRVNPSSQSRKLLAKALDDPDQITRYHAASGLAKPGETLSLAAFQDNEDVYLKRAKANASE